MFCTLSVLFLHFPGKELGSGLLVFLGTRSRSCLKTTSLPVYLMSAVTEDLNSLTRLFEVSRVGWSQDECVFREKGSCKER